MTIEDIKKFLIGATGLHWEVEILRGPGRVKVYLAYESVPGKPDKPVNKTDSPFCFLFNINPGSGHDIVARVIEDVTPQSVIRYALTGGIPAEWFGKEITVPQRDGFIQDVIDIRRERKEELIYGTVQSERN
jgi:hypothetical protein